MLSKHLVSRESTSRRRIEGRVQIRFFGGEKKTGSIFEGFKKKNENERSLCVPCVSPSPHIPLPPPAPGPELGLVLFGGEEPLLQHEPQVLCVLCRDVQRRTVAPRGRSGAGRQTYSPFNEGRDPFAF